MPIDSELPKNDQPSSFPKSFSVFVNFSTESNVQLKVSSTIIENFNSGINYRAEDGTWTRDLLLGKQTHYQLCYSRERLKFDSCIYANKPNGGRPILSRPIYGSKSLINFSNRVCIYNVFNMSKNVSRFGVFGQCFIPTLSIWYRTHPILSVRFSIKPMFMFALHNIICFNFSIYYDFSKNFSTFKIPCMRVVFRAYDYTSFWIQMYMKVWLTEFFHTFQVHFRVLPFQQIYDWFPLKSFVSYLSFFLFDDAKLRQFSETAKHFQEKFCFFYVFSSFTS